MNEKEKLKLREECEICLKVKEELSTCFLSGFCLFTPLVVVKKEKNELCDSFDRAR